MPGRYSHPPTNRLLTRKEFDQVFQHGSKQVGRHFVCYAARMEEPGNRLGMVVSRKVGKAVVRNRVKRYIREYFRTHQETFSAPTRLVVVARAEAAGLESAEAFRNLQRLLEREGLLRG